MLKWFGRIAAGLVILSLIGAVGTYAFVRNAVDGMFGGKTTIARTDIPDEKPEKII